MSKWLAAAVLSLALVAPAGSGAWSQGKTPEAMKLALANIMNEMLDCITYYGIASVGLGARGNKAGAARTERIQVGLLTRVFIIATKIGMKREAVKIRMMWSLEKQSKLIGNDMINMAILIDKYGASCKSLIEQFEARLGYWLRRAERDLSRTPPAAR